MSIRSRYTSRRSRAPTAAPPQPAPAPRPQPSAPKQSATSQVAKGAKTALVKSGNALKKFAGWVAKNQETYKKQTGDTSLDEDLRSIPIRVCRNAGNAGRDEQRRIHERCRADEDDELCRYLSGRPSKRQPTPPPQRLEFIVKPKPKRRPKPKPKVIYVEYDPSAEVGYYGKN